MPNFSQYNFNNSIIINHLNRFQMKNKINSLLAVICLIIASASLAYAQNASPASTSSTIEQPTISTGKNILTFAPLGIGNKLRFRFERVVGKSLTLGAQLSLFYGSYPGVQAVAVGRFYFADKAAPFGLYLMGQGGAAYHTATTVEYKNTYVPSSTGGRYIEVKSTSTLCTVGAVIGGAIGYQGALDKKKRWVTDIYLGFKGTIMSEDLNKIDVLLGGSSSNVQGTTWALTGPGSIINCGINLGYRFYYSTLASLHDVC